MFGDVVVFLGLVEGEFEGLELGEEVVVVVLVMF